MSFRAWLSIITVFLLVGVLIGARKELVLAWQLLDKVNLWILALMIPGQIIVYFAAGEMIFSYIRSKGQIRHVSRWTQVRISLEGNFVNHILPSGGVSGVSYLTWRLGHLGISPGRATMAQVVRHVMAFVAFATMLLLALIAVTVDGTINRWIILTSATLFSLTTFLIIGLIFLLSSNARMKKFSDWLYHTMNLVTRRVTFGKHRKLVRKEVIDEFLEDMHRDFLELRSDKRVLLKPYLWGLVFTIFDAVLFMIAFWSLGEIFNPAPILIAYGVASVVGLVVLTPGGIGAYEAIMVTFLAFAGIPGNIAIAGILLARVCILLGTIIFGYAFYQMALNKYGGPHKATAKGTSK